jgi:non-ribosomal peptide synthetase component F
MVLLAVYTILLSRYTGQEDIVVGTPIAGRPHPDLANIIGMFVNTLAMRNFPDVKKSFREFLDEVKLNCLDAYDNQDYQYEQLVDRIGISQRQNWNSFFGTMFAVQNTQANIQPIRQDVNYSVERLVFRPVTFEEKVTQFDIIIHAYEIDEDIHFKLRYCTGLFKRESIEMFIDNFKEIATTVVDSMDIKLKEVRVTHYLKTADPNIPHADFTF